MININFNELVKKLTVSTGKSKDVALIQLSKSDTDDFLNHVGAAYKKHAESGGKETRPAVYVIGVEFGLSTDDKSVYAQVGICAFEVPDTTFNPEYFRDADKLFRENKLLVLGSMFVSPIDYNLSKGVVEGDVELDKHGYGLAILSSNDGFSFAVLEAEDNEDGSVTCKPLMNLSIHTGIYNVNKHPVMDYLAKLNLLLLGWLPDTLKPAQKKKSRSEMTLEKVIYTHKASKYLH